MNETTLEVQHTERQHQEASEERVWEAPGYSVVETALEVTAYALGER
ncbi:pyrroloquinoline quinone precursor peptide PqqA [Streptomyces sp. NPDC058371]